MTNLATRSAIPAVSPLTPSRIRASVSAFTCCLLVALALFAGAPSAFAQTETQLYRFGAVANDGSKPGSRFVKDAAGNLYGTATTGGTTGHGTVFQLVPPSGGSGLWSYGWVYNFRCTTCVASDGAVPVGGLILDAANGILYGTTEYGGTGACSTTGCGTVYSITTSGSYNSIYSFQGGTTDGEFPLDFEGLVMDSSGNLYGTTLYGGAYNNGGTVWELSPSGSSWTPHLLYSFNSSGDGRNPYGSLVKDTSSPFNLYGTTNGGGAHGVGAVFELTNSGGSWHYNPLHDFAGGTGDGKGPTAGLDIDNSVNPPNLYGTASTGGNSPCAGGCGTVFAIPSGGSYSTIYNFLDSGCYTSTCSNDGKLPYSAVVMDNSGNLYGTTNIGGNGQGTIYELSNSGSTWSETMLYPFAFHAGITGDGAYPYIGELTIDNSNTPSVLYGTTYEGGFGTCGSGTGCGIVFSLVP